ncbi:MAG: glycosyltransferase family 4 protein [Ignavibacteriae bacterium]|nr:glycosyltransferase family 4 protein [Ignavibacteriota bacterium]
MRIGVNCFLLQASIGGLKQYFQTLFRELLASDSENEYVFFYFEHNVTELEAMGNDRWRENAIRLDDQLEVQKHLDKIDLYFCPFGALWPIPLPLPTVVTIVDVQEKYYPEFFSSMDHWNRDYYYYGSSHQADAVITISEFSKQSIVRFHRVSPKKIHVVYLSVDPRYIQAAGIERPLGQQLPEKFVFYPSNHWKHKNHECLLNALQIIKRERQIDIPVIFTGFGQQNGYPLQDKIQEMGICATTLEFVSVEQMIYLYRRAKLLCFPSLFEGFGIPLVEAMCTGCPIVCANTSSVPEVVGDAAALFDPRDPRDCAAKILAVWTDSSLQKELTAKGYQQAQKFTSSKLAQGHLAVFRVAHNDFSFIRYLKNKLLFNPMHNARLKQRMPQSSS